MSGGRAAASLVGFGIVVSSLQSREDVLTTGLGLQAGLSLQGPGLLASCTALPCRSQVLAWGDTDRAGALDGVGRSG